MLRSVDFPTNPPIDLLFSLPIIVTLQFLTVIFTKLAYPTANKGDAYTIVS